MEWFKMQTCWGEAVDMLTDEEAGRLFKNIYAYVLRGETRKGAGREDLMAMIVLEMLKRDIEKYEAGAAEEEKKKEQKRQRARNAAQARWKQEQPVHADACAAEDVHADECIMHHEHPQACQNKNKEKESEKEKEERYSEAEGDNHTICSELLAKASELPAVEIPLNDGSEYPVFRDDVEEYAGLYPAVDVVQELRNMRGWCLANPSRRKTRRGVRSFVNNWLSRAQDRGAKHAEPPPNPFLAYARGEKTSGGLEGLL